MNTFDFLKDVIINKTGKLSDSSEFKSAWSSFMMTRYLSMKQSRNGKVEEQFVEAACQANRFQCTLSSKQMYKYMIAKIVKPKDNSSYIKYISKPKTKKTK